MKSSRRKGLPHVQVEVVRPFLAFDTGRGLWGTVWLGAQTSFFFFSKSWKRLTLKFPWRFSLIPAVVLKGNFSLKGHHCYELALPDAETLTNISYLQFRKMNPRFYAVIKIFAQWLIFCIQTFEGATGTLPLPGYALVIMKFKTSNVIPCGITVEPQCCALFFFIRELCCSLHSLYNRYKYMWREKKILGLQFFSKSLFIFERLIFEWFCIWREPEQTAHRRTENAQGALCP